MGGAGVQLGDLAAGAIEADFEAGFCSRGFPRRRRLEADSDAPWRTNSKRVAMASEGESDDGHGAFVAVL